MRHLLLTLLILCACDHTPDPVARGKCLADVYHAERVVDQVCTLDGYRWHCVWSEDHGRYDCQRLGEATGERGAVPQ